MRYWNQKYNPYEDDYIDDRGANDEYESAYCACCCEVTERDLCTGRCVDCGILGEKT